MDVPEERDIEIGTKKKNVSSPKTKTSKLWIDKGHLKINDMEELLHTCKYKSSNNIIVKKEDPKLSFGNFIKDKFWDNENEKENIQLKPCRKRILSFNNEFQLVPLLRKVSCEPDPTCGKSNISKILLTNKIKTWFLRWIRCTWSKIDKNKDQQPIWSSQRKLQPQIHWR